MSEKARISVSEKARTSARRSKMTREKNFNREKSHIHIFQSTITNACTYVPEQVLLGV